MKIIDYTISKYATISLLVIYVLVTAVYIFTLPPSNHLKLPVGSVSHTLIVNKTNGNSTAGNLLHRGFRSSIEKKNKIVIPATAARILLFLFIFGSLALLTLADKVNPYLKAFYKLRTYTWLSLRTIRI